MRGNAAAMRVPVRFAAYFPNRIPARVSPPINGRAIGGRPYRDAGLLSSHVRCHGEERSDEAIPSRAGDCFAEKRSQ